MRISYSSLNTYQSCPLKYKYQNIDKIKAPKNIDALFGSSVHASLKFMFQRGPLYPAIDQVVDFFRTIWEQKKMPMEADAIDSSAEVVYYKEGISILEKFYKNNPPWNFNVADMESWFEFDIDDPKTDEKHIVSGIMDRIDKNADGNFEIIDYKTKRKLPSQKDIDNDLQMSIYQLGLLKKWPHISGDKIKLSFYFLKHGEKISTSRTAEQIEETKKLILDTIRDIGDKIKNNGEFPPYPSGLCDWCEYKQICPMWRHMYRKQNEKDKIKNQEELNQIIGEYFRLKDQNGQNNDRLDELKTFVYGFMDEQGVERVFNNEGYLTRTIKEKNVYDLEKVKEVLMPVGKWDEILEPDEKKIDKLLPSLSDSLKEKISALAEKKKTTMLSMKKKVSLDDEEIEGLDHIRK